MTILIAQPSRLRLPVGLTLLAGLLILRFPLMILYSTVLKPAPPWVLPLFMDGTYILNALLIFWERDRLEAFHIDRWALGLYLLTPLLMIPGSKLFLLSQVQVGCAAALALLLLLTRTKLPGARRETLIWLGIAVAVGVALGIFNGVCLRWQTPLTSGAGSLAQLPLLFLIQFSRAATFEEPLFRGFLWGYLKSAGWKDLWIWLLQAGLFVAGHAYYIGKANISFLLIVPVGALVMGWIAWRSRSIGSSMIVHGLGNGLGDLVGHSRW
ncbi:MAG TPA: CPBP family intramembrane glutamic endopeptidase [Symbiobacteriaceae bacterium]|nr:CPBP family intramembrane glutamic endopeptidase [Symbiobacteriaceae bacterium]